MKKFINEVLWLIILMSFSFFIFQLIVTNKINYFVHPRMNKYILLSLLGFIILSLYQFKRLFHSNSYDKIKLGYALFVIPLFLAFAINPESINGQALSNKGINMSSSESQDLSALPNTSAPSDPVELEVNTKFTSKDTDPKAFTDALDFAYSNYQTSSLQRISLTGFVFRQPEFSANQFVTSRLVITCCAADAQVAGLLCEWSEAPTLSDDQWINVKGTLTSTNYLDPYTKKETTIPLIKVLSIEKINEPENKYIYP